MASPEYGMTIFNYFVIKENSYAAKRNFTPQQKVAILRVYLKDKTSIPALAQNHYVHTNLIYFWEKSLSEGVLDTLSRTSFNQSSSPDKKIPEFEVITGHRTYYVGGVNV